MFKVSIHKRWLLGIFVVGVSALLGHRAQAQITPDMTLPNNSIVTPNGGTFNITGGTQAGANLFHSFREFSVSTGGAAFFNNALDIRNIISRVTGGNISNIDGLIRTLGTANLFLINPSGIVFGPNASLNVGGSFVASTASAIQFGNQGFFSATNPDASAPLLTINPSALFFDQRTIAAISNSSVAPAGQGPTGADVIGLRVPDGQSLLLVGGDVNLNGGNLRAYGGRVELAGLAAPGTVGLNLAGNTFSLGIPQDVQRANVSLSALAEVNVRAQDGGSIAINAQNVNLAGGSKLRAGIESGLGTQQSKAGDIEINATGETVLSDGSFIANVVQPNAVGQAGDINITTGALTLSNGAILNTRTFGRGNGGNVSVLSSGSVSLAGGGIFTDVRGGAVGNGGDINIQGASLSLTDGAQLISAVREADSTNPSGRGNAGNVNINVRDALTIGGEKNGFVSGIFSSIDPGAIGNGGNISISAGSVSLTNGSDLDAASYGLGNGGNIIINARDTVAFDGVDSNGIPTRARTALLPSGEGIAGDIKITTGSLFLSNGALFFSDTFGKGNGGSITINARDTVRVDGSSFVSSGVNQQAVGNGGDIRVITGSLSLTNGAQLSSSVTGQGNAGNITIDASDTVKLDGVVGNAISGIQSNLLRGAGKGGDIQVTTGSLSVTNGAELSTNTNGRGNAGNITINARDTVTFDGVSNNQSLLPSNASSVVVSNGIGNGGDIRVSARELLLKNGAQLSTDSFGQGKAGNIQINVSDTVSFDGTTSSGRGSGANTLASENNSKAGDILVQTGTLSLTNGGRLNSFANTFAGNITINARDAVIFDGTNSKGGLPSGVGSVLLAGSPGKGGDIKVTTGSVTVRNGAQVNSSTSGQGDAGNVIIDARGRVSFDGTSSDAVSTVEQNGVGKGGDIRISADSLFVTNGARLRADTSGKGDAGNVILDARGSVSFDNGSAFSSVAQNGVGKGGDIRISADSLSVTNGARFSASTVGQGHAGNVIIDARGSVSFDNGSAFSSVAQNGVGKGGDIRISADSLSVTNGAGLSASTGGKGDAGNVIIDARGNVSFDGTSSAAFSTVDLNGVGKGGDIRISADTLSLTNGAQLVANTFGQGNAGNIEINAPDFVSVKGTSSSSGRSSGLFTSNSSNSTGIGGNITVNTPLLRISDGAVLDARTNNNRNGGNITLNVKQAEILNGGELLSTSSGTGNAGKITVNATDRVIVSGSDATFNSRVAKFGAAVAPVDASSGFFVSSQSTGSAGDIEVTSPQIRLDNSAKFSANTTGGGGNIQLKTPRLILRRGSSITTNANGSQIPGGNINIDSQNGFIVAVPRENSYISANSANFRGGNITINNSAGIFGIEQTTAPSNSINYITATGATPELSGNIRINRPDINQPLGLVKLPTAVANAPALKNNSCAAFSDEGGNEFTVTGRGGLPPSPYDLLSSDAIWSDNRLPNLIAQQQPREKPKTKPPSKVEVVEINPATGWVFHPNGLVTLISQNKSANGLQSTPTTCQTSHP